ncbi:MAG: tRNA (adenosine(37)-N6)-dimethylallyltransferase MiaA [Woeseiaceae bacterium]|nr:tRNA (adenosine(37)-N6)-dimethylallyltransferase MiaA [Woeseiaceae bacterium]
MTTERTAICLMGPTASGKTDIAVGLSKRFPLELISVDSALVYRGMDIGTAKPDAELLARAPHRLIDIREPEEPYSAGDFVRDAREAIDEIHETGRVPLLVGGTMMYFRALTGGIAELPAADPTLRAAIDAEAEELGWPALHAELQKVDPESAGRIKPNDRQRIQRALEVFRLSGRPLSDWQAAAAEPKDDVRYVKLALNVTPRSVLHARIEERLNFMINNGFVEEVEALSRREGLVRDAASMRAVGYRQLWAYVAGECSLDEARYRALVATRQLAKRQITWLRSEPDLELFDPLEDGVIDAISAFLIPFLDA